MSPNVCSLQSYGKIRSWYQTSTIVTFVAVFLCLCTYDFFQHGDKRGISL